MRSVLRKSNGKRKRFYACLHGAISVEYGHISDGTSSRTKRLAVTSLKRELDKDGSKSLINHLLVLQPLLWQVDFMQDQSISNGDGPPNKKILY